MVDPSTLLFADHATGLGGAEHSLLMLLKHLNRQKYTPHLICPPGALSEAAQALNIPTHHHPFPALRRSPRALLDWQCGIRQLSHIAKQIQATAIISNTIRSSFYASLAARLTQCPFIWYMRDFWLSEMQPRYLITDRIFKYLLYTIATCVITNSRATANHLPSKSKTSVIHNGIELSHFSPMLDGHDFRKTYHIPDNVPLIGTVGRLRPWKGQDRFLQVVAQIKKDLPTIHSVIVGGNPFGTTDTYYLSLQELSKRLGIRDQVVFTGQLKDPQFALAAMDIFVHPGDPEPFGLVNVEAMAMANPVVAFAHGALPEIVVAGETGYLISPGDKVAMAAAIVELWQNPERRLMMGQAGRNRAEAQFSVQRTVHELEIVLDRMIK
ncbi:MAG: glycosyltransferase family 4 protein [Anaerolineae bacterium]|nr:glycosyltransferase family 4 protein [Anaerolineae bacterium]